MLKEIESWEPEVIHVHTDGSAYRMTLLICKHKHIPLPFLSSQRDRLVIVPNGIDLEKYRNRFSGKERETFRKTLGISGCTGVLVTASRLSKEKNMREMISLFSAVLKRRQDVKYLIVGDGPTETRRVFVLGDVDVEVWMGDQYLTGLDQKANVISHPENTNTKGEKYDSPG